MASVTLAVLAVLVSAWIVVAANPRLASPESYSLPMRRLVGFAAVGGRRVTHPGDGVSRRDLHLGDQSMIRPVIRSAAAGLAVLLLACPSAWAIGPPVVEESATPPTGNTGPAVAMTQRNDCVTTGVIPGTLGTPDAAAAPGQAMLNLTDAWRFSRGEGQTVAVIDTGVQPGPRLPNVEPGGDYVANTDGLTDCDGHGTLVAGIIAGQPGDDGSPVWRPARGSSPSGRPRRRSHRAHRPRIPAMARAAIDIASLARAVVHAADLGARVINISTVTCLPADNTVDQAALGAALRYAAVDKDAVIVAAAGSRSDRTVRLPCQPVNRPGAQLGRGHLGVGTVLVAALRTVRRLGDLDGQPSAFTMAGPWLGIAAPGENIVSVSNGEGGGLANGMPDGRGELAGLNGTSYAAAYVSGAAALVRSRFPDLTAAQVIDRLTATAHRGARAPSNVDRAGTPDPVAALTWQLPAPADATIVAQTHCGAGVTGTGEPHPAHHRVRRFCGPAARRRRHRVRRTPTKGSEP